MYNRGSREGLKGMKNTLVLTVLTKCLKGESKPKVMMFIHPINVSVVIHAALTDKLWK